MKIDKSDLISAAIKAGIPESQALNLWEQLSTQPFKGNKFDLPHVLYYFGALLVISAMGWFLGTGWEKFGGKGILAISLIYIAIFIAIGSYLWRKDHLKVPGGLFITLAVCIIPLAIYGFQTYTGLWITEEPGRYVDFFHWVKGGWFLMEIGTILGSLAALWFFRFPFLTTPLFFTLWFVSMDITPLLFGMQATLGDERLWVSLFFGLAILIVAYFIDHRTKEDFAFWGYFFGMLAFWCGLTLLESDSEVKRLVYCLINVVLILLSVLLQRTIFLVFGAIGVFGYVASLFYRYFHDSTLFPFILTLVGVATVFLGIFYSKRRERIEGAIIGSLPRPLLKLLPQKRHRLHRE